MGFVFFYYMNGFIFLSVVSSILHHDVYGRRRKNLFAENGGTQKAVAMVSNRTKSDGYEKGEEGGINGSLFPTHVED
jgi:hypothetical protein